MNPYSSWSECPKCEGGRWRAVVSTNYDKATDTIERKCCGCGYTWHELPRDRRPVPEKETT